MSRLPHILIVALVLLFFVPGKPIPAMACTCISITVDSAYAKAAVVFLGRVMKSELKNLYPSTHKGEIYRRAGEFKVATLEVKKTWKGTLDSLVEVRTALEGGLCGVSFAVGDLYLVYATDHDGQLGTNICARSREWRYAQDDIKELDDKHLKSPD